MTLSDNLDEAMVEFEAMMEAFDAAIVNIESELAAGRSALTAYHDAAELFEAINECAAMLAERIDEARRLL